VKRHRQSKSDLFDFDIFNAGPGNSRDRFGLDPRVQRSDTLFRRRAKYGFFRATRTDEQTHEYKPSPFEMRAPQASQGEGFGFVHRAAFERGRDNLNYVWSAAIRIRPKDATLASNLALGIAAGCFFCQAEEAEGATFNDENCATRRAKNFAFRRFFKSEVMTMELNPDRTPRGCHHGCLVLSGQGARLVEFISTAVF
jgi:hypothetical protein